MVHTEVMRRRGHFAWPLLLMAGALVAVSVVPLGATRPAGGRGDLRRIAATDTTAASASSLVVLGSLLRSFSLAPGADIHIRIEVRNTGTNAETVRAYLSDFAPSGTGPSAFARPGTVSRSNARWITLQPEQQVLPAGETGWIDVRLQVPETPPGSGAFWSVVMIEGSPPAALTVAEDDPPRLSFREVFRTAVRIVTDVDAAGRPAQASVRFRDSEVRLGDLGPELHLHLENDGQASLRLDLWVEIFDQQGLSLARVSAQRLTLLPGEVGARRVVLEGVPPGQYEALVVADNHDAAVFGVRYRLQVPAPLDMPQ